MPSVPSVPSNPLVISYHLVKAWAVVWPLLIALTAGHAVVAEPIPVADIQRDQPVDFQTDILPILQKSCLSCHNQTDAESELVLELPETMRKGGSQGPAIVPGKPDESLLLALASHQMDPVMPPEDNDVSAAALTSEQLGLIKLWIKQGASGERRAPPTPSPGSWQEVPANLGPILAVAMSADGQLAAAGHANQIAVYHLGARRLLGHLVDPQLASLGIFTDPHVAHLDMVQSLAISHDRRWIASGGFRTTKLWKQVEPAEWLVRVAFAFLPASRAVSPDGSHIALGDSSGRVHIVNLAQASEASESAHRIVESGLKSVDHLAYVPGSDALVLAADRGRMILCNATTGAVKGAGDAPAPLRRVASWPAANRLLGGGEDGVLYSWPADLLAKVATGEVEAPESNLQADRLGEVGSAITGLAGWDERHLLVATEDGRVLVWDSQEKKALRQVEHKPSINDLVAASDADRAITIATDGTVRLWKISTMELVSSLDAPPQRQFTLDVANLVLEVAKRQLQNAQSDLEQAQNRHKQEEENVKKTDEELKKANEELIAKSEAATKASQEHEQARFELVTAQSAYQAAEEELKSINQRIEALQAELSEAKNKLEAAGKRLAEAQTASNEARQRHIQAQVAVDADPQEAHVKQLEQAKQQLEASEKQLTEALDQRNRAHQRTAQLEQSAALLQKLVETLKPQVDQRQPAVSAAEEKTKKALEARDKARNELTQAEEKQLATHRSLLRAQQILKQVADEISQLQQQVAAAEQRVKDRQQALETTQQQQQQQQQQSQRTSMAASFSAGGQWAAILNQDGVIEVADPSSGTVVARYPIVEDRGDESAANGPRPLLGWAGDRLFVCVPHSAASADGASQPPAGQLLVGNPLPQWKLAAVLGSVDGPGPFADRVTALDFSPDDRLLAVGGGQPSRSGEVHLIDLERRQIVKQLSQPHSDTVFDVAFSPDGQLLASCGADRFAKVFRVDDGQLVKVFEGHTHHVLSVDWRADGRVLATAGADRTVKLWDLPSGSQLRTISGFGKEVTQLAFLGAQDRFAASSGDTRVYICGVDGSRNGVTGAPDFLYSLDADVLGTRIAFGGHDGQLRIVAPDGKSLAEFGPQGSGKE